MANFDVVVIGASAGGVGFLQRVAAALPETFSAAVFVTLHLPEGATSVLPRILDRAGRLHAAHAEHGAPIVPGRIYVAPPGFHLTLEPGRMCVTRSAREHGHIPAIDPLFRSAALAYGPRAIGVVLSGLLDDGTVGMIEIKRAGGIAVAQDPDDTTFPSMPQSAIAHAAVDYVLPADEIGALLHRLTLQRPAVSVVPTADPAVVAQEIEQLTTHEDEREKSGVPSPYGCPECGGVLWELTDEDVLRFRCRVGHAYTAESLANEQARDTEKALWMAIRALEEQAAIRRRLMERLRRRGQVAFARRLEERIRDIEQQVQHIRDLLLSGVGAQ